jgi:membrane protein DedA with SNARE-associated domain
MAEGLLLLERYGYVIVATLVIAEQIGIPLPAVPALLGVGALAADGRMSLWLVLASAAAAGLATDLTWYELGRRRGARVLDALRRGSLTADFWISRAEGLLRRYVVPAFLIAKFVPGLTSATAPLAGLAGIGRARFLLYDLAGILLWAGTWSGLGYVFSDALGAVAALAAGLWGALAVVVAVLAGLILVTDVHRRRFIPACDRRRNLLGFGRCSRPGYP